MRVWSLERTEQRDRESGGQRREQKGQSYPSLRLQLQHTLVVHKDDVDDLDFNPPGVHLVTVASTAEAQIFRCVDGSKVLCAHPHPGHSPHPAVHLVLTLS